jgi:hypothetical protein
MALKSDIQAASDNRPLDLHERRVVDPNMDMSQAILDLRNPQIQEAEDSNFFFEFLPAAAAHLPILPMEDMKDAITSFFEGVWSFVKQHPRYFVAALLALSALVLFGLSVFTHRSITRTNAETPAAATTTIQPAASASTTTTTVAPAAVPATSTATQPTAISKQTCKAAALTTPHATPATQPTTTPPAAQPTPDPTPPATGPTCQVDALGVCIPALLPNIATPLDPVTDQTTAPLIDVVVPE